MTEREATDRMPIPGWVAVACLAIASSVTLWGFATVVLAQLELVPDLGMALRFESTWNVGGPLLVYGLVLGVSAIGVARRWRVAHALTVIALGISIGLTIASLGEMVTVARSPEAVVVVACLIVAWICLVLTWSAFWRRPPTRREDDHR